MSEPLPQDPGERSLWAATAVANPVQRRLAQELDVDVLVVGGGYTGLSCALHLAEANVSVALLEARSIGFGGSGRNSGLVNAGVWQDPEHVRAELGDRAGERFNLALRDSPALVAGLVERYRMRCDWQPCGTLHVAHNAAAMQRLESRFRQLRELGAGVELVDAGASSRISGSPVYVHGGILDPGAATINPLGYARELARAALERGARLYQDSAITGLERHNERWLATTAEGRVTAAQVVLATNAYADRNSRGVRESTVPVFIFQCATEPLPPNIAAAIIPGRQGLWDTQLMLTSSRIDASGRLVMSSAGRLHGAQSRIRQNWMARLRNRLYPQTRGLRWEYYWSGQIGVTSSKILRVQLIAPGIFAPAGYNGRGVGTGSVIGKHLAQALASGNRDDFPFPIEALYREKWRRLRGAYYDYATLALQLLDRRDGA